MTSIVRNGFATVLALALLGSLILLAPAQSWAQEKHKISWSAKAENTKYAFRHLLEIPDMVRPDKLRRTCGCKSRLSKRRCAQ